MNDFIQTELEVSRNGFHFERCTGRKPNIPHGKDGSWDAAIIFANWNSAKHGKFITATGTAHTVRLTIWIDRTHCDLCVRVHFDMRLTGRMRHLHSVNHLSERRSRDKRCRK
jgi:hypothetical protein